MTDQSHLRRKPAQERSRRRVEAIVTAASELFAGQGFDKTTMDQIAHGAGVSVGSVYQFFPNKRAVFTGVSERCATLVRDQLPALLPGAGADADLVAAVDRVVDGFAALLDSDPAFKAVWSNSQFWGDYEAEDRALASELASASAAVILSYRPDLGERAAAAGHLIVQTISAALLLRGRFDGDAGLPPILPELKLMIRGYLEMLLSSA